jgi:hypothetical protein
MDHHGEHTRHDTSGHPPVEPHQDLHVCLECSSELVYPVEWAEAGAENWGVLLHCPKCDVHRYGVFSQRTVDALDTEIDRARGALARAYEGLLRMNMAAEIERFVAALNAGAILPEDF